MRPARLRQPPAAIPKDRLALAQAIQKRRKADHAVEEQQQAILRAREMVGKSEDELDKLRAAISKADTSDDLRAASLIR